jgi:hypothetical protein
MGLKKLLLGAAIATAALAPGATALAATSTVTGNVAGGALSLVSTATPSFSVTLDGTDQTATYSVPAVVTDARGNGAGWNLTVTSTQFTTGGGSPSTLATDASRITSATNQCVSGATCTDPTNSIGYPVTIPAAATPPAAVKYFNAATGSGRGKFDNTADVSVAVPANTDAGTYSSTLTLSAVSGP